MFLTVRFISFNITLNITLTIFEHRFDCFVQYRTKHCAEGIWVDCGLDIYPLLEYMVSECAPLVQHYFRVRAHNELGWSDWGDISQPLITLRRH